MLARVNGSHFRPRVCFQPSDLSWVSTLSLSLSLLSSLSLLLSWPAPGPNPTQFAFSHLPFSLLLSFDCAALTLAQRSCCKHEVLWPNRHEFKTAWTSVVQMSQLISCCVVNSQWWVGVSVLTPSLFCPIFSIWVWDEAFGSRIQHLGPRFSIWVQDSAFGSRGLLLAQPLFPVVWIVIFSLAHNSQFHCAGAWRCWVVLANWEEGPFSQFLFKCLEIEALDCT